MYWTSSCLVSETKQGPACLVSGWEKGLKKITESNLWLPLECTGMHAYTHTSTQVCACINTHTQNPISAPFKEAVSKSLCLEHRASRCLPSAQVLLTISASRSGYREQVRECSVTSTWHIPCVVLAVIISKLVFLTSMPVYNVTCSICWVRLFPL